MLHFFLFGDILGQLIVYQFFHFVAGIGKTVVPKGHQFVYQVNYFIAFFFIKYSIIRFAIYTWIMRYVIRPFIVGIMQISSGKTKIMLTVISIKILIIKWVWDFSDIMIEKQLAVFTATATIKLQLNSLPAF